MKLTVTFHPQSLSIDATGQSFGVALGTPVAREYVERDPYTGSYTVTPTNETQTLRTKNYRMTDNVVINPIPSNYGLITWNGSTLTVS